ncbi:MAG: sensor histidine kinase [Lachnospiraceae bacterium]
MKLLRKIQNLITNIKVQKQLYFIYFIAIFIPVVTIGGYLVYNTCSQLFEHYENQSHSDNLRVKSLLLDLTSNVYNKGLSLSSNQELKDLLSTEFDSSESATRSIEHYKGFSTLLSQDISIQSISIYTPNSTLPESKYIHQITEETEKENWYQKALNTVTPFWTKETATDDFGNERIVLCLHIRIFLPQVHSHAFLNLTVSNNHIKNRIENSSLNTVLWLNEEGIFYSSSKKSMDPSLTKYVTGPNRYYLGKITLNDQKVIGCVSSFSTAYSDDLFYVASLNYDGYPHILKVTRTHFLILFLILAVTSAFIYAYSHYFSKRVITLRENMHHASQGNYHIVDTFNGEDEISEAFADLNIMIQDILHKEASVYEAELRAKELENQQHRMEFKMLSSQINPHFLYNTLESIRMRALKAGNRDVATAIKLLGKSMRYVLENTTTSFTTLAKELDYIETYLAIQKLRFHDRINYSLKIYPSIDLNEYQIMPLLLQPIVENAIIHGLEDVERNGKIIIHIHKKNDILYIHIFDNGCGMTSNELHNMKQNIYHHPKESSKSIGLYNIYQRIRLCFGSPYGLQIKSKKRYGTLITVIMPAQKCRREIK